MMVAGNNHIDKEDFLYLYPPAREAVFIQGNICNGFAGAGLKHIIALLVAINLSSPFLPQLSFLVRTYELNSGFFIEAITVARLF
jgi:hypothetical protein